MKLIIVILLPIFLILIYPTTILAQATPNPNLGPLPANIIHLQQLIQRITNIVVYFAFIALTFVLIWAGIKFLTSGADAKAVQAAWDIITWGILGILFLGLAWLILNLIQVVTGVNITTFCLGFDC